MEDKLIGVISASTNIEPSDIKYEVEMLDFSSRLFSELEKEKVPFYLFGGTALNKGFFGGRQRLSKDLDIELDRRGFDNTARKFESIIIRIGYPNFRAEKYGGRCALHVYIGKNIDEIKIDITPQKNTIKGERVTLHSVLEYAGIPVKTVDVMSYPFEYLLAYKVSALQRRMLYKDIYDTYIGLQLGLDASKFMRYLGKFGNPKGILNEIMLRIDDGEYDAKDELNYSKLVQERYKVSMKNMLYEIKAKFITILK